MHKHCPPDRALHRRTADLGNVIAVAQTSFRFWRHRWLLIGGNIHSKSIIDDMAFLDAGRRDCLRKMKHGATLGGSVGAAAGLLFGAYEAAQIRSIPVSQVGYCLISCNVML